MISSLSFASIKIGCSSSSDEIGFPVAVMRGLAALMMMCFPPPPEDDGAVVLSLMLLFMSAAECFDQIECAARGYVVVTTCRSRTRRYA